jgi:hypothetical protein
VSRQSLLLLLLLLLAIAVPATAQTFGFAIGPSAPVCVSIGDTSYRVAASGERADYTVRIDPGAAAPDIRIQLTGSIDEADFVFIENGEAATHCSAAKAVKIDAAAAAPDLILGFADASVPPDYRIYVRSRALAPEAAAALYAAAHIRARRLAGRAANRSN